LERIAIDHYNLGAKFCKKLNRCWSKYLCSQITNFTNTKSFVEINYLDSNYKREQQLDTLLAMCGLISTVHFPTRIQNSSVSALDSIFTDVTKNEIYIICPLINRLSDHDAQIIKLK
jgi:hypothetical protein